MGEPAEQIKERIRSYILKKFLPGEDPSNLQDDTPLTSSGILDSVSVLKVISFVEDTYGLTVEHHEATTAFDCIQDIAALVTSKE